ncbi:MAG TPA: dihydropteroate synthase [Pyrinomonadaceae bacterium]|jgi:dihydropteroate synthase|nr:dihydropteroate synthase [Pyrinomonadaceae bacterium]
MSEHQWKLARRSLAVGGRTLVMGILNVTPDSFSDGGEFFDRLLAVAHAEKMVAEGADILDIGGESTRPGGAGGVSAEEEIRRIVPVVEAVARASSVPVSIDTTKAEVARAALDAGAEIVNDISALRFDPAVADEAARAGAGLVLMHSRGTMETMHTLEPVADIMSEVTQTLRRAVAEAERRGVARASIALDPGVGFSKSQSQNLELIARLDDFAREFRDFTVLIGTSRKSFIGRILGGAPVGERLHGTLATVAASVLRGAHVVRVHDVRAAVETVRVADAIKAVISDKRQDEVNSQWSMENG